MHRDVAAEGFRVRGQTFSDLRCPSASERAALRRGLDEATTMRENVDAIRAVVGALLAPGDRARWRKTDWSVPELVVVAECLAGEVARDSQLVGAVEPARQRIRERGKRIGRRRRGRTVPVTVRCRPRPRARSRSRRTVRVAAHGPPGRESSSDEPDPPAAVAASSSFPLAVAA